jgi:hypothetical protein
MREQRKRQTRLFHRHIHLLQSQTRTSVDSAFENELGVERMFIWLMPDNVLDERLGVNVYLIFLSLGQLIRLRETTSLTLFVVRSSTSAQGPELGHGKWTENGSWG